jgi:hypothetical protein
MTANDALSERRYALEAFADSIGDTPRTADPKTPALKSRDFVGSQ